MKFYQCVECHTYYAEQKITKDGVIIQRVDDSLVCQANDYCKQVGLCVDVEGPILKGEVGMCVFLMDSSGSMGNHAFKKAPRPSILKPPSHPNDFKGVEDSGFMSKREMTAYCAAYAVFELNLLSDKKNGYLGVIFYDYRQKLFFFKPIEKIFEEYKDANTFALELLKEMKDMHGATDISSALKMVYNLVTKFEEKDISALGTFYPMIQDVAHHYDINSGTKIKHKTIKEKNIRVVLYTDGEQLAEYGALSSPFEDSGPVDPLICAYIGQKDEVGHKELSSIARYCPVHGEKQLITVDDVRAFPTLRGIFRMASGGSGFCLKCLLGNKPTQDYSTNPKPTSDTP